MKKKILALILSVVVFSSSTVCALASESGKSNVNEAQITEDMMSQELTANVVTEVSKSGGLREETSCRQLTEAEYEELQKKGTDTGIATYSLAEQNYWKSFSNDYYYNKLTTEEKQAWDELEQKCIALASGTDNASDVVTDQCYFSGWKLQDVYNFIFLFRYAHPQFYFLSNHVMVGYYDVTEGYYLDIELYNAFQDGTYRQQETIAFCSKVDSWVEQIKQQSDILEEQMEKAVYDLVCENTTYEFGTYDQSAYSLVCEGKTVCAGYAAVFQMLMNAVGIDTIEVTSSSHAWNLSNIHGVWYEVDTTWADGNDSYISYAYYNKSEDTISQQGYDSSHVVRDLWENYQPEAMYDSLYYSWYESPYFENGDYTWFIVNDNESLDGGYLATPVETKNGARYDEAPSAVDNGSVTYSTMKLKQDSNEPVKVKDIQGLKIGGRAGDAIRLNWNKDSNASGYIIEQNKNGKWTRIARIGSNATTTYRVEKLVPSTTYQFRVQAFAFDGSTPAYGNYAYISGMTNPAMVSGAKIGGHAGDALRLNWNKNEKASGYIIEQYKNNKWIRIARIGSNATTTYRVEKLSPSTTYKFRIQAFGFDGKTPTYGNYAYVSGKTNLEAVSGLKIGGWAKDALRLNWNKDSKASGYIIEQYKDGRWTRIARIGSNATTTYRVEKLQSKTIYKFRIQAFGFDGSTPIYGTFSYTSGTTK